MRNFISTAIKHDKFCKTKCKKKIQNKRGKQTVIGLWFILCPITSNLPIGCKNRVNCCF